MAGYELDHLVDALVVSMVDNSPYESLSFNNESMPALMRSAMEDAMLRIATPIHQHIVSWWNEEGGGIFPDEMVKMTIDDPISGYLADKIDDVTIKYDLGTNQLYVAEVPLATNLIVGGVRVGNNPSSILYMNDGEIMARVQTSPLLSTSDIEVPSSRAVKLYVDASIQAISAGGSLGDMLRSTYDTDLDGIVDNAERLNNQLPVYYLNWTNFTNTPTTIAGYGITNAYTKTEVDALTWDYNTDLINLPSSLPPIDHNLVSGYHAMTGLTPGYFLKAITSSSFDFAVHGLTYTDVGAEAALGNPASDGYILSSTAAGVRSWVTPYTLPTTVVDASGTPVSGQVSIFIDANTITGYAGLTYNNSTGVLGVDHIMEATTSHGIIVDTILILPVSTTSLASLRIPHGSAPTTPTNGDIWSTTTSLFIRVNGTTIDLAASGSTYTFQYSIAESGGNVNLVNDTSTPGNSKLYGTNSSGVRGWYDIPTAGTPTAHATTHQDGGSDEISVTGLAGVLADAQTPINHGLVSSYHTASGLTTGYFLKATGATTFAFGVHGLTYTDVGAASSSHDHSTVYEPLITKTTGYAYYTGSAWSFLNESYSLTTHNHSATYEPLITKATGYATWNGSAWSFLNEAYSLSSHNHDISYISIVATPTTGNFPTLTAGGELQNSTYNSSSFATAGHNHSGVYQPLHANLTSLAGLIYSSLAFIKMSASGTFTLDTNTYSVSSHSHSGTYEPIITKTQGYAYYTGSAWSFLNESYSLTTHNHDSSYISIISTPTSGNFPIMTSGGELQTSSYSYSSFSLSSHDHSGVYQPLHANLTSLAGLTYSSLAFIKMSASGTFTLDTNTYSLSSHDHDSSYISIISTPNSGNFPTMTSGGELQTSSYSYSSFATSGHNHDASYQPLHSNLTSVSGLSYVSLSFVKMSATGVFSLDTNSYSLSSHSHSATYEPLISKTTGYAYYTGTAWSFLNETYSLTTHNHSGIYATVIHNFIDTTNHPVSGLTTGHFLKATGATTYAFAVHGLTYTDVGAAATSHTHGNITNAGAIGSTSTLPIITTTSGVLTTGSFGTGSGTFCQGNDSRLSDARTPVAHDLTSSYHTDSGLTTGHFLKATGATTFGWAVHGLTYTDVGAAATSHTHTNMVDYSGTPVSGQIAIFTDTNTILGYSGLTYNNSTTTLSIDHISEITSGHGVVIDDVTIKDYIISSPDGTVSSNNGMDITIKSGSPYNITGADAGNIILKAADAISGDISSSAGRVELVPGNGYNNTVVGLIYLGNSTFNGTSVSLLAGGSATNVSLFLASKGSSVLYLGTTSAQTSIYGTTIRMESSYIQFSNNNSTIRGGSGTITNPHGYNLSLVGGSGYDISGNNDGGDIYIYGGEPYSSGIRGNVYFGDSVTCYIPIDNTETSVVAIDSITGLLSRRTVSSITGITAYGTPVDNQVAIWTGSSTIEGSSSLLYDGTTLSVSGDIALLYGANRTIKISDSTASLNGYALTITAGSAITTNYNGGYLYLKGGEAASGSGASGNVYITGGSTETDGNVYLGFTPGAVAVGYVGIRGPANSAYALSVSGNIYTSSELYTLGGLVVGGTSLTTSCVMQINSTTGGFRLPSMTTTQRTAISSPTDGLEVWDVTLHRKYVYANGTWRYCNVS